MIGRGSKRCMDPSLAVFCVLSILFSFVCFSIHTLIPKEQTVAHKWHQSDDNFFSVHFSSSMLVWVTVYSVASLVISPRETLLEPCVCLRMNQISSVCIVLLPTDRPSRFSISECRSKALSESVYNQTSEATV